MEDVQYQPGNDYYEVFGIRPTASPEEIARAHKRLAKEFHPDLHPDKPWAKERFQEINRAYEVLRDPVRKGEYDRLRWAEIGKSKTARTDAGPSRMPFRRPAGGEGHVDPESHRRERLMGQFLLVIELFTVGLFMCLGLYAAWHKLHG
jgi:curved DNA-binding protein CbpA